MATTSSSSSRQPLPPPERPSRVSRSTKEAGRSSKGRQQQIHRQHRHHQGTSPRDELVEADEGEDAEDGLSREEAAALIDARFHRAVDIIQSLPKSGPITTTYEEKLMLYSLYKQGAPFIFAKSGVSLI